MKKIGFLLALILILSGFTGFLGGALISSGIINYEKEVPLGGVKGIVVDTTGNIYIGLGFYGKVQVYDNNGVFLKNWNVDASGGTFNIDLTKEQHVLISTARGNKQMLYDQNGTLLSKKTIDNIYNETKNPSDRFSTKTGEIYKVKGGIFPVIQRTSPDDQVIVEQEFLFQLLKGPFPAWFMAAFGVVLILLIKKKELIEYLKNANS